MSPGAWRDTTSNRVSPCRSRIVERVRHCHILLWGTGRLWSRGGRARGRGLLPQAKILAVAYVIEATLAHRPYRAALGLDAALAEIEAGKGRLYDPAAVEACVGPFRNKGFNFQ